MKKFSVIFLILLFIGLSGFRIYHNIIIKKEVTGYLKRATDASTIELALNDLQTAIKYLENNNLTTGFTSILYESPDEDVAFWYNNLKASEAELEKAKNSSSLEKTNVLLKLKESLLDDGKKSSSVTYPAGISIYPNNKLVTILFWISLLWIPMLIIEIDKYEKEQIRKKQGRRNSEVEA